MSENEKLLQPYEVSRGVYRCNSTERKMLYYAALLVQHKPFLDSKRPSYNAEFRISEMLFALGMPNTQGNRELIKKAVKKIAENTITLFDDEDHLDVMNWLQRGIYDNKNDIVRLQFTEEIGKLFVMCRKRFSLINLKTIGGLKSFYAMRFYEIALSYKGYAGKAENEPKSWYFERTLDEIKTMFKVDGYEYQKGTNTFIDYVIKQPIAELNKKNPDFVITLEKQVDPLDRRRAVGFKFTCKVCGAGRSKKKVLAVDTSTQKLIKQAENERIEAENDFTEIEKMKALYMADFAARLDKKQEQEALKPVKTMTAILEKEVYSEMLAAGYGLDGKERKARKQKEPTAKEKKTRTAVVEVPKDTASPAKSKELELF